MTKEQEVIKYTETRIKICNENADICDDNDFDEEATYLREESYMLETVLSMLKEKDKEMEKKDKIIDLMADFINKTGAGRRVFSCTFRKNDECNENGCRYCIKQYFKEIAERKSER